jgi:hypothetical protein
MSHVIRRAIVSDTLKADQVLWPGFHSDRDVDQKVLDYLSIWIRHGMES